MEKSNEERHAALNYDDLTEKYKSLQKLIEKTMAMHKKVREDLEGQSRQKQREVEIQGATKKPRITSVEILPSGSRFLKDSTNSPSRGNNSNENLANRIKETIKIELLSKDSGTKRDYKLSPKVKFEHFYEFLSSELRTNDLLHVIDATVKPPQNLNEQQREKQRYKVRDILINRLDQTYHSKILQIQDPAEIIEKLREFKRCEVNVTSHTIRQQLYSIKYDRNKETALQFWDKFEEIIRTYENLPDTAPLTEQEKRDAFYAAIANTEPEVQSIEFMTRSQTGRSLIYDALKRFIIQAEANRGQTTNHPSSKPNTITSVAYARLRNEIRCFECDDLGHMKSECPRKGMGLRKCYGCGKFTNHKAAECPNRTTGQKNQRRRGGCRGRQYDNNRSERFDNRLHSNNKRSFKRSHGGKHQYGNRQDNHEQENQNSRNNRYAKRGGYRGGYRNQRGTSKPATTSTPQANLTNDQQCSVNNNQGENIQNNHFDVSLVSQLDKNKIDTDKRQLDMCRTNRVNLTESNSGKTVLETCDILNSNDRQFASFIADSGATEHLANTEEIFQSLNKAGVNIIKCANKNSNADLIAEGKGTIHLFTNSDKRTPFVLNNVICSKSLSSNLLSLRHFVEAGWKILLDNKSINIFDPNSNETLISGKYDSPFWLIEFEINKRSEPKVGYTYDTYVTKDKELFTIEGSNELQVISAQDKECKTTEAAEQVTQTDDGSTTVNTLKQTDHVSATIDGMESSLFSNFDTTITDRKITNVDELPTIEILDSDSPFTKTYSDFIKTNKAMLWHARMGHSSLSYLIKLQKIWKTNRDLQNAVFDKSILDCEICALSKLQRLPFQTERRRATRPLQIIHSDVMGKISPLTHPARYQYISVFIDDYSRLALAYPMKSKDQTGHCLERFLKSTRNLLGRNEKVCYLRSDQGTEYMGGHTNEVLKREGIEYQTACPDTPQHNGVSERFNQTIQKKVRAYMLDSKLPLNMWDLALGASIYVYNRTPHSSINYETPLTKFAPDFHYDISQLKRFGCMAYWLIVRKPETKFSPRAIRGVLVGYMPSGYLFLNPETGKFFESRNVRFNEKLVYGDKYKKDSVQGWPIPNERTDLKNWTLEFGKKETKGDEKNDERDNEDNSKPEGEQKRKRGRPRKRSIETEGEETTIQKKKDKIQSNTTREPYNTRSRMIKDTSFAQFAHTAIDIENYEVPSIEDEFDRTKDHAEDELMHCLFTKLNNDPQTYGEAMNTSERNEWSKAVQEELDSMDKNEVWTLVDRPTYGKDEKRPNIIDSKWVFKKKSDTDGKEKFKARLVIRGFKDTNSYDLKETYAPVSRLTLVRTILAMINYYNLDACQLDVKTAFLNGTIEEDIFMEIPEGVQASDQVRRTKVCKLKRALYGLRISPKRWNEKFTEVANSVGLKNDDNDPCLFTWRLGDSLVILIIYVDDMLLASNNKRKLIEVKAKLMKAFEITDLGEPKNFLSLNIQRNREIKTMLITQEEYINKILNKFGFDDEYPKITPMVTRQVANRERKQREEDSEDVSSEVNLTEDSFPYREAVGSLLYLAGTTRPDIAYAVNILSRHQRNPTELEWNMVKRVFQYLKGTKSLGLNYLGRRDDLVAFSDASFADCKNSISTCGYVIRLFGDTISWRTTKQSYVALSTCQAEYVAMSQVCQETISIDKSIQRILNDSFLPATLYCDNRAAIFCAKTSGGNKLRHMTEIHEDYVKECVKCKRIVVDWVPTKEQWADIMTKPLSFETHTKLRDKILNYDCSVF